MSKRFRGMCCVYCLDRQGDTDDHVISRQFFPADKRGNLPKVPACGSCNNEKSQLEHYLTAVVPFGATHSDAGQVMEMTGPRLAKNQKLHSALVEGASTEMVQNGSALVQEMTLPIDGAAMEKLFEFIVRGLAWHHWKVLFSDSHFVRAAFITSQGQQFFEPMFAGKANARVKDSFGDGVFVYEGIQSLESPDLTMWRMSLYGAKVGGDPRNPGEKCSSVYGMTIPKRFPVAEKFLGILGS